MKVLHVNTNDLYGGAARATNRLHNALKKSGIDSCMLVQKKKGADNTVFGSNSNLRKFWNLLRPIIDKIYLFLYKRRERIPWSISWFRNRSLLKKIKQINPDIVHLHWINGGFVGIKDLKKISVPIVWTFHDMWPFTGGCHYNNFDCKSYLEVCGNCPVLKSNKKHDLSYRTLKLKMKEFKKSSFHIICPSSWLKGEVEKSALFSESAVMQIPNTIDTSLFKPVNKRGVRLLWNLPLNKQIVAFGAMDAISDFNKGYDLLKKALSIFSGKNIHLVVFGASNNTSLTDDFDFPVYSSGILLDDISLIALYNAVDVMVVPSRIESFGQTASEAMSCGTPVVAFGTTGLSDIVDHKKNGYLARPYDPIDLAKGIEWVLKEVSESNYLSKNAREKVVSTFDYDVIVPKIKQMYSDIIES